ncbi:MAG: cytochrome c biogenesis protein CcdA [Acidimicrobiia bacterium]|nr:cytochrome c biogenesis protein CcdA [Acidimicrobiia bacterium]
MLAAIGVHDPGLIGAFGGGMLSFLSPCVLPLVPGYLSLVSGISVAELQEGDPGNLRRVVVSTLLFVAGFTAVFVALGAAASGVGQSLREHQRGLEMIAGVIVMVMGVFLAGFVSPRFLMAERRMHVSPSEVGAWAPPLMGAAFAFGWTPCIGPILAGVLGLAEHDGTLSRGVLLLAAYSLGLGVPFIITGVAFDRMAGAFAFVKRHFRVINLVAGAFLFAFGFLLFTHRLTRLSSYFTDVLHWLHLDALTKI